MVPREKRTKKRNAQDAMHRVAQECTHVWYCRVLHQMMEEEEEGTFLVSYSGQSLSCLTFSFDDVAILVKKR